MSRFDYVRYDDKAQGQQAKFKEQFQKLTSLFEQAEAAHAEILRLHALLAPGRAKDLALTKFGGLFRNSEQVFTQLEEGYAWIGKALRDEQIARNGSAPLQEERSDS